MNGLKSGLRQGLTADAAFRLRQLGRIRWLAKRRVLRHYGHDWRRDPWTAIKYILVDPEVGDFNYELRNERAFAAQTAAVLGVTLGEVERLFAELRADPELTDRLSRRMRRRIDMKHRVPFGPRISWYAMVRVLKPRLVVETGVRHGIGSLVLLRALERNAEEGVDGRLLSVDGDERAGWIVPDHLRDRWTLVNGWTTVVMDPALEGEAVDLFFHDTTPGLEIEAAEYAVAIRHANPQGMVLTSGSNGNRTPALPTLARRLDLEFRYIHEEPDHFYDGAGVGVVYLDAAAVARAATEASEAPAVAPPAVAPLPDADEPSLTPARRFARPEAEPAETTTGTRRFARPEREPDETPGTGRFERPQPASDPPPAREPAENGTRTPSRRGRARPPKSG